MSIPTAGSGGVGSLGAPLQRDYAELQSTAAENMTKLNLGLIPNTIDIPLTQLGGNLWKYRSSENKPSLPMFVAVLVAYLEKSPVDDSWKTAYQNLVNQLSTRVKWLLKKNQSSPLNEQNPAFTALDHSLKYGAIWISWLEKMSNLSTTSEGEGHQLSSTFVEESLNIIEEILLSLKQKIDEQPPTSATKKNLELFTGKTLKLFGDIKNYIEVMGGLENQSIKRKVFRAQELALEQMTQQLQELQIEQEKGKKSLPIILSPLLEAMAIVMDSLREKGSPFLLALSLNRKSLTDSQLGLLGKNLNAIIEALTTPLVPQWSISILQKIASAALIFILALASQGTLRIKAIAGMGEVPAKLTETISYRMTALLLTESQLVKTSIENILRNLGLSDKQAEIASRSLDMSILIALALASPTPEETFKTLKTPLEESLNLAKKNLDFLQTARYWIRQAEIALKNNPEGILEVLQMALKPLSQNVSDIQQDLN